MIVTTGGAPRARVGWALWAVAGGVAACGPAPATPVVPAAPARSVAVSAAPAPQRDPCEGEGAKGLATGAPWPMSGRCARHTSRGAAVGPSDPAVIWKRQLSSTSLGGPVIGADGTVFIGSRGLDAFDAIGRRRTIANEVGISRPAIGADGTLYVAGRGVFSALSPDGAPRWTIATGGALAAAAAIGADGTIYFGTSGGVVHAAAPDGAIRWKFETDGGISQAPAIGPSGDIYFSGDTHVYALHPDGTLAWKHSMGERVTCPPSIGEDGTLYVSNNARLAALGSDGVERWALATGGGCSPAIGPDGTLYVRSSKDLVAVSRAGVRRWSVSVGSGSGSPSIDARGTIYTTSADRKVYAVGPDGAVRWTLETLEPLQGTPVLDARGVLLVTGSLGLWGIGERVRAPGETAPPPGGPPIARRGFLTEDELLAPRPGERLCTTVRTVNHQRWPAPFDIQLTLRQFEDARGLIVRVVNTQIGGTFEPKRSYAVIRWDARSSVTAVETDTDADGLADESERWSYDAGGALASIEHDEDNDGRPERTDRYEVSVKRPPAGATTGLVAIPERFLLLAPVTEAPDTIPGFEGVITRSEEGEGSHRVRRTYDAHGWLVKEESWPTGAPVRDRPEAVTTFSRSAAGELLEKREKVAGHDGARIRYRRAAGRLVEVVESGSAQDPAEVETSTYAYDASGKLKSAKRLEGKTVLEESEVERTCE